MPLINDADAVMFNGLPVDAVYISDTKVWPAELNPMFEQVDDYTLKLINGVPGQTYRGYHQNPYAYQGFYYTHSTDLFTADVNGEYTLTVNDFSFSSASKVDGLLRAGQYWVGPTTAYKAWSIFVDGWILFESNQGQYYRYHQMDMDTNVLQNPLNPDSFASQTQAYCYENYIIGTSIPDLNIITVHINAAEFNNGDLAPGWTRLEAGLRTKPFATGPATTLTEAKMFTFAINPPLGVGQAFPFETQFWSQTAWQYPGNYSDAPCPAGFVEGTAGISGGMLRVANPGSGQAWVPSATVVGTDTSEGVYLWLMYKLQYAPPAVKAPDLPTKPHVQEAEPDAVALQEQMWNQAGSPT